jgi:hypothetical protein
MVVNVAEVEGSYATMGLGAYVRYYDTLYFYLMFWEDVFSSHPGGRSIPPMLECACSCENSKLRLGYPVSVTF